MASESILIIDDNPEIRHFLIDLLHPLGYTVSQADRGREGLKKARWENPDLILLDLNLPDMSGIEVLEALQEEEEPMSISVILMTLHGSERVAVRVFRLGVCDYIIKPFEVDRLLAAIERTLEARRLRREKEELLSELSESNRRLKQEMRELSALRAIGRSVASLMALEDLLRRVVDASIYLTGAEMAAVFFVDEGGGPPRLEAARHRKAYHTHFAEPVTDRLAASVIRSQRPLQIIEALGRISFATYFGEQARALLYVPISLQERILGVLSVAYLDQGRSPTQEVQLRLSALADQIAIALENAHLHAALRQTVATQTIQEIMVTLSHYINNPLQTLRGVSHLWEEQGDPELATVLHQEIRKIEAVVSILREITVPESTLYLGSTKMLDIERALQERLASADK